MKLILFIFCLIFPLKYSISQESNVEWVKNNAVILNIDDSSNVFLNNKEALIKSIGQSEIVLLGEETHGDGKAFQTKVELIKFLHEELNFDVLAFESSMYLAEVSNDAVKGSTDPLQTLRGATYPHWSWTVELQPLWYYISNSKKSNRPIDITGFDYQSISKTDREVFPVEVFKKMKEKNILFKDQKEQNDYFTFYSYLSSNFSNLPIDIDIKNLQELLNVFINKSNTLLDSLIKDNSKNAQLLTRVLKNNTSIAPFLTKTYLDKISQKNTKKVDVTSFNIIRDSIMADNIIWLKDEVFANRKIIVWAANFHISRNIHDNMGSRLYKHYNDKVYSIAFVANQGEWGTINMKNNKTLPKASEGTLESVFHKTHIDNFFLDFKNLSKSSGGTWLNKENIMRPHGYTEEKRNWVEAYDGVIFNNEMTNSHLFKRNK